MPSAMELEYVPKERQHPQLAGTDLRPIEDVLNDPEATGRGLTSEYAEDPDFRAHVAVFEKGYQRLLESGPVTEERLHRLIDHLYATNAIERHAEFLTSRAHSNPQATFDIEFCTYLDLAVPIDPSDRHAPNQADDGKLYWVDHLWRQGEHLADRQRYDGIEEPEQAEVAEKPRSEKLRESLDEAREIDKKKTRIDAIAFLGGTAVIPIVELAPSPDLATKAGLTAAAIAMGGSVLRWAGRRLSIMNLGDRAKNAERDETLRAMLPTISTKVTVSQAIRGLQYELETLELAERSGTASLDTYEEDMAIDAVLRGLEDWARFDDTSVGHLYWLTRDLAGHAQNRKKYDFYGKRFEMMAQKLNKYLPIDQEADTVTPVDEFSGEKTWQKFAEKVAEGKDGISLDSLNSVYFSRLSQPKDKVSKNK